MMLSKITNWFSQLWPRQVNHGQGSTQVGRAGRDVTVIHLTQNFELRAESKTIRFPVFATAEQKEVLKIMKLLPEEIRIKVLDFMRREFDTGLVKELKPYEVRRVRGYVLKVLESLG